MADEEQVERLLRSTSDWNDWRQENPGIGIDLRRAPLRGANLRGANLIVADLRGADLNGAHLLYSVFVGTSVCKANVGESYWGGGCLGDTILHEALGLETTIHLGATTIGTDTLYRAEGGLPDFFLRGAGVPENLIAYHRALVAPSARPTQP